MSAATPTTGRRHRGSTRTYSAEDQALNQIAREAEARLAAKRAARAEARDIRMRELEKQQRDAEEKQDKHFELRSQHTSTNRMIQSVAQTPAVRIRRGSDDSTDSREDQRELKTTLAELEEKYKRAMMSTAQLDNEKQSLTYQVEILKDKIEEMEESMIEIQRECKNRNRELEQEKRKTKELGRDNTFLTELVKQRDNLIQEHGLVLVGGETAGGEDRDKHPTPAALVTTQGAEILQKVGEGTLDERLKAFQDEKQGLLDEVKKLKQELESEREKNSIADRYGSEKTSLPHNFPLANGPDTGTQLLDIQREASRQISEYKIKLQKADQDITTLEGNIIRLESQVKRYKTQSENSEKIEDELKAEKRKLQRELREAMNTVEEVQNQNNHLQKRLEKIKSARNALVTGRP